MVKNLKILEEITDISNDFIDVCFEDNDGYTYTLSVCTPEYLSSEMERTNTNFWEPGADYIVVRKLTKDILMETFQAYEEEDDGCWLNIHQFGDEIDKSVFEELKAKHIKRQIDNDLLDNLEDLKKEIQNFDPLNTVERAGLVTKIEKLSQKLFDSY